MILRPYLKSVVALIGSVLTLCTFLLGMGHLLPENISSLLAGILAVATPASVWLVKNQPLLEQAADAAEELFESYGKHAR